MKRHHHEDLGAAALELCAVPEIKEYFPKLKNPSSKLLATLTRGGHYRKLFISACSAPDKDTHIKIPLGHGLRDLSGVPGFGRFASFEHFAIPTGHHEDGTYRLRGYSMAGDESLGDMDDWATMEVEIHDVDFGQLNELEFVSSDKAAKNEKHLGRACHYIQDACCWHHTVGVLLWGHSVWERRLWEHYRAWAHKGSELDIDRLVPHVTGKLQDTLLPGERSVADIVAENARWTKRYMQHDGRRERAMEGRIEAETAWAVCARALASTVAAVAL